MGVPDQAMRIWMNPDRMASLGITTTDIANAVNQQNAAVRRRPDRPAAERRARSSSRSRSSRRRRSPSRAQYENIILRASQDGSAIVRLGDVARAEVGLQQYIVDSKLNGVPATFIAVYQQPGANGLIVSKAVRKTMEDMKARFPEGMDYVDLARHQRLRPAVDRGGDPDAVRGDRAGRAGRLPVPAELPHDDHLHGGDRRRADRHVRRHAGAGLLDQPAHAVRPGARDRHGRRRRDRRGRERRAQHGAAPSRARRRRRSSRWTRSRARSSPSCW